MLANLKLKMEQPTLANFNTARLAKKIKPYYNGDIDSKVITLLKMTGEDTQVDGVFIQLSEADQKAVVILQNLWTSVVE